MYYLDKFKFILLNFNLEQANHNRLMKQTCLTSIHRELGAKMVSFGEYLMPLKYTSIVEEHYAVRQRVGLFDVSHMGEFLIKGSKSLALIQKISANDASRLAVGQAQYSYMPNHQGGVVDDMLVYRLHPEVYMLVVNAANIKKDWAWIHEHNAVKAAVEDISAATSLLAFQGPLASTLLQPLTGLDLSKIKYYRFAKASLVGLENIIISATGYTGAGGFELYVPNKSAESLWGKLLEIGSPVGLGARDSLRLEMGYCLYGNDIDDETSPLEAGLGWITKFNKTFIHSAALLEQKQAGLKQKLVGFEVLEPGIARHAYPIFNAEGTRIGRVTSGGQSPSLKKAIGLGYIQMAWTNVGTIIFIGIRQKRVKAVVRALPFLNV